MENKFAFLVVLLVTASVASGLSSSEVAGAEATPLVDAFQCRLNTDCKNCPPNCRTSCIGGKCFCACAMNKASLLADAVGCHHDSDCSAKCGSCKAAKCVLGDCVCNCEKKEASPLADAFMCHQDSYCRKKCPPKCHSANCVAGKCLCGCET